MSVYSDDISDFQIEEISLGDSLLDYLEENHIKSEIDYSTTKLYEYKTKDFAKIFWFKETDNYDYLSFIVENDESKVLIKKKGDTFFDKKYIIHQVNGKKHMSIKKCLAMKKKIVKDFSLMITNATKTESKFSPSFDPSGKSLIYFTYFTFDSKDEIAVECYDYSQILNDQGKRDGLFVNLITEDAKDWLSQTKQ